VELGRPEVAHRPTGRQHESAHARNTAHDRTRASNVLGLGVGFGGEDVADVLPVDEVARHMDGEELARSVPDK
jgi:tartrate dehydratase alpha subunit/fumarate hydratase class I-like protein